MNHISGSIIGRKSISSSKYNRDGSNSAAKGLGDEVHPVWGVQERENAEQCNSSGSIIKGADIEEADHSVATMCPSNELPRHRRTDTDTIDTGCVTSSASATSTTQSNEGGLFIDQSANTALPPKDGLHHGNYFNDRVDRVDSSSTARSTARSAAVAVKADFAEEEPSIFF